MILHVGNTSQITITSKSIKQRYDIKYQCIKNEDISINQQ